MSSPEGFSHPHPNEQPAGNIQHATLKSDAERSLFVSQEQVSLDRNAFLQYLIARNPFLKETFSNFFQDKKPILFIGGESGMGKSLLTGVIRTEHAEVNGISSDRQSNLAVITWDRMNEMMYNQISIALGTTIRPPDGEVPFAIRNRTAFVMAKTIDYVSRNKRSGDTILVESPLLFDRGEKIFEQFPDVKELSSVVYMYSPESRLQTMRNGRDTETAGQLPSMTGMRATIFYDIFGNDIPQLSQEQEDKVVEEWLKKKVSGINANILTWNPDEIPELFESVKRMLGDQKFSPDYMYPPSIGWYAMQELEDIVKTIDNLQDLVYPN